MKELETIINDSGLKLPENKPHSFASEGDEAENEQNSGPNW